MTVIIDISVLLAVLLNEKHKPAITEATKGHNLQAPASLDAEVGKLCQPCLKEVV
jgi:predicted nucleic acid-binding protein